MRALAAAFVLVSGVFLLGFAAKPGPPNNSPLYMAFCDDGDGQLTGWVASREEAYLAGRDHERANHGHRWEVLVQQSDIALSEPSCALVADGSRPETLRLENTCSKCMKFKVSRKYPDGSIKSKEFSIKPGASRGFRKVAETVFSVDGGPRLP